MPEFPECLGNTVVQERNLLEESSEGSPSRCGLRDVGFPCWAPGGEIWTLDLRRSMAAGERQPSILRRSIWDCSVIETRSDETDSVFHEVLYSLVTYQFHTQGGLLADYPGWIHETPYHPM